MPLVTTLISILGVMLGVMSMIVVLSVMTGFVEDLRGKILGTYSHVVLLRVGMGMENYMEVKSQVEERERVRLSTHSYITRAMPCMMAFESTPKRPST
jgi:lipoprotein-releasing system permease protein